MGYADELFDLTDRVVLVTGGSRGLGREMAFAAAQCGADVVIASRKIESCEATAEEITSATGRAAMPYQVHVGRWDQLDGLVDAAYERFGKVDVLINNAGMSPLYESLDSVYREAVRRGHQPEPQGPVPVVDAGGSSAWWPTAADRSSTSARAGRGGPGPNSCPTRRPRPGSTR